MESHPGRGNLRKTPSGIAGFGGITRGGLPQVRTTLPSGDPGSGKTINLMDAVSLHKPHIDEEVARLIEVLHDTSRKLDDITAGEIDGISTSDGHTYLLPHAQNFLLQSEATKQAAILNGLPARIALLNNHGTIIAVNEAWRRFAEDNLPESPDSAVGANYVELSSHFSSEKSLDTQKIAQGVQSVLSGESKAFSFEYACPYSEQRWFMLRVTPISDVHQNGAIVMHLDITEQTLAAIHRQSAENELFVERERARTVLNSLGDAVVCIDVADNVTFLNVVAEELTGCSLANALGRPIADVLRISTLSRPLILPIPLEMTGQKLHHGSVASCATMMGSKGKEIAIDYTMAPIYDRDKEINGAVYVFRDVSEARELSIQNAYSAQHDFLTGLPNRTLLNDRIGNAIALAARHKKKVVVLFLDLDGFKHINDSLGHPVGDILLQSVAKRLSSCVRGGDTVSRQGGDEFIILLSEVTNLLDAANKADLILKRIADTHCTEHHDLHVTGSIGISVYPDDGLDAETLIKNSDTAMYQAKANGRQSYQFFTATMNVRAVERQAIEENLRRALKVGEFELHYQPRINLRTRKIIGAEALVRWEHPTRGLVPPLEFIPIAEDCGLIVPIGAWVLRMACQQAKAWNDAGHAKLMMSVNVSAIEFSDPHFLEGVFRILEETKMDPHRLELELTESVLMKSPESAVSVLQALRNKGISIAIDDFGTGYSSLSYLRKFPVDALKIDQSFVRQIEFDGENSVIVKAVIGMARSLKLRVVAEGIESLQQLQFLASHHCDEAQGYYFSKPLPASQFAKLLHEGVPATFYTESENNQRTHSRHRVLKDGKIVSSDMQSVTDVKIRDLSATGARLQMHSSIQLPKVFSLLIVSERLLYPAIERWRKSNSIGIEFVGTPHVTALRVDKTLVPGGVI